MKGKKLIKLDVSVPANLRSYITPQEITSDFVLEIYETAKKLKGKKKDDLHKVAETFSKNIGKWLVE